MRIIVSAILIISCISCTTRYVDYAYSHDVWGIVVNKKGEPIRGVVVERVENGVDMNQSLYGVASIYKRTTDKMGRFRFYYSGLGGKPDTNFTWHLLFTHRKYKKRIITLTIPWRIYKKNTKSYGYVKESLRIILIKKLS